MKLSRPNKKTIRGIRGKLSEFVFKQPYWSAVFLITFYLVCFRWSFMTTGDAWAESFAEYLDESLRKGWSEVFAQNWAGYLSIVPSFLAKFVVWLHFPLGYIDYFFRYTTILFAVLSSALVALKVNRSLVANDYLRIFLALLLIVSLEDVASFSFINIWYIGLVPILFIYLNKERFSQKFDVGLGVFGALLSVSKPFLIILPIAIFRAIRSRQYAGPAIITAAAALQTYQILFNDAHNIVGQSQLTVQQVAGGIFLGTGTAVLKLINIAPTAFWHVVIANILLCALFVYLLRHMGFWITSVLAGTLLYSIFTYVLSPDSVVYHGLQSFASMYDYNFKTQREILVNGVLLISILLAVDTWFARPKKATKKRPKYYRFLPLAICVVLFCLIHRPLDTNSAAVSTKPFEAFRTELSSGTPSCIPLSPTQTYILEANWFYSYKGICTDIGHDLNIFKPDFKNMNLPINEEPLVVEAKYFRLNNAQLVTLVIPLINRYNQENTLVVTDTSSKKTFSAKVEGKKGEVQFVAVKLQGVPKQNTYTLVLDQEKPGLQTAHFKGTDIPMSYSYFLSRD